MQLFVTLDQAAQGRVQGEWPFLSPPHRGPTPGPPALQPLPNPVLALQACAGTSMGWKVMTSRQPAGWWRPRGPASPTPGRPSRAAMTSWTGWMTPAPSTLRVVRLSHQEGGPAGPVGMGCVYGDRGEMALLAQGQCVCQLLSAMWLVYGDPQWQPARRYGRGAGTANHWAAALLQGMARHHDSTPSYPPCHPPVWGDRGQGGGGWLHLARGPCPAPADEEGGSAPAPAWAAGLRVPAGGGCPC